MGYLRRWISWVKRERERERVIESERPPAHHLRRLPLDQLSLVTERERGQWRKRAETSAAKSRRTSMPWPRFFSDSHFFSNRSLSSNCNPNFFF